MGFFYMIDPMYWLFIGPAILLALLAQIRVKTAFSKYSKKGTVKNYSGAEAAALILRNSGVDDVRIEPSSGWLSDHYDPRSRTLRLSPDVLTARSIAAVGIAAHEAGHALQHAKGYAPMKLRSAIVPVASIGSSLAWPMIFIGFFLNSMGMVKIGIVFFAAMVVFQIVTLPVEFNASSRARKALINTGILANDEEIAGVRSVLGAAALTYVAGTIVAIMQLLYFLLRAGLLGGSDD